MTIVKDQHFMVDKEILEEIIELAGIKPDETVLEIGAGKGHLTAKILNKGCRVIAIESDSNLVKELKKKFRNKNIEIVSGNALDLMKQFRFDKIVSNPPYAILEPLIMKLIYVDFKKAVLTVPKHFAYRLNAREGERDFSTLSLHSQTFFKIRIIKEIPKTCFNPIPKTSSVIITIEKKPLSLFQAFLKRNNRTVKNSIIEACCEKDKITKKQAREKLKELKLSKHILDIKVKKLEMKQLLELKKILKMPEYKIFKYLII